MFLPNPGILAAGAGGGPKTYAEFQTHIRNKAINGKATWAAPSPSGASSLWTTCDSSLTGGMYGSTWLNRANVGGFTCRFLQHAFYSESIFISQASRGLDVYFEILPGEEIMAFVSVSRNGYTSLPASPGPYGAMMLSKLIRWDEDVNKAFVSNPYIGSSETEYTG